MLINLCMNYCSQTSYKMVFSTHLLVLIHALKIDFLKGRTGTYLKQLIHFGFK